MSFYQPKYAEPYIQENDIPDKAIENTFYLIGDAGISPMGGMSEALTALNQHLQGKTTTRDFVLFLGDNIYPAGMPKKEDNNRTKAENSLNAQISAVSNFKGRVIFIPGNHDWYANGLKGLKRQEKYVEEALGKNTFLPENGCPLERIDVGEKVQLILIDTQWYLENWNHNPTINDHCEIKTRERFFEELEGELKKAQNKTTVIAMHHLFPTQKKIPVPGMASLIAQVRTQGGVSVQDRYNERYHELMSRLETLTHEAKNMVFVSGHEHTLQYIENETIKQIVSGSGAKEAEVALGNNALFASGRQGFAELTIFKDGSTWVKFFDANSGIPKLLFTKEIFQADKTYDVSHLPESFPQEVEVSIYSKEETDVTGFFESVWGDHYRDVYSTRIKAKVATLDTLYGGLEVVRNIYKPYCSRKIIFRMISKKRR